MFGLSELAVILVVVIVVLAVRKGPALARSAGKSARILKAERNADADAGADAGADAPRVVQGEVIPSDGPPRGAGPGA